MMREYKQLSTEERAVIVVSLAFSTAGFFHTFLEATKQKTPATAGVFLSAVFISWLRMPLLCVQQRYGHRSLFCKYNRN